MSSSRLALTARPGVPPRHLRRGRSALFVSVSDSPHCSCASAVNDGVFHTASLFMLQGRAGLAHDSRLLSAPASASGPPEPALFLESRRSTLYGPEAPYSINFSRDMKPAAYSEQVLQDLAVSLVYVAGAGSPLAAGRALISEVAAMHARCELVRKRRRCCASQGSGMLGGCVSSRPQTGSAGTCRA